MQLQYVGGLAQGSGGDQVKLEAGLLPREMAASVGGGMVGSEPRTQGQPEDQVQDTSRS